ncbi:MAG TPA: phenylalanine--tRNA ligase subunit alpha [Thermomicrobiales bacterium]|nr:phenylalanine--tRNA ligase subunit alpha [Thermomicrobiales bacterium]
MATTTFQDQLDEIRLRATDNLETTHDLDALQTWERQFLGSKGELTGLLRGLGAVPAEERPAAGRAANALKQELTQAYEGRKSVLAAAALEQRLAQDAVDVTLPGRPLSRGVAHPVSQMIRELSDIFAHMGFQTVFGREVETTHYNFDLLNIPKDHPARDVWDTMIVERGDADVVLRTHTSPMQARVMEASTPPVRVVVPGRCYRYEAQDASHEWMFHQLEGLAVDEQITMADLKGVLQEMARQLFGAERRIRFRCDFFPFVEPGVDFAVDCIICNGKGCRVCKQTGWLEMGGAGMVHPNVLRGVGYDPEKYTGFAFGLGIERLVMMKYRVQDIRAFAANDLRFLSQFAGAALN